METRNALSFFSVMNRTFLFLKNDWPNANSTTSLTWHLPLSNSVHSTFFQEIRITPSMAFHVSFLSLKFNSNENLSIS
jgi:hypothetical protein